MYEQIKAEIERRIETQEGWIAKNLPGAELAEAVRVELNQLLDFIESRSQPSEDLEEEIDRFEDWMETYNQTDYPTSYTTRDIARHFAQWQKEQMIPLTALVNESKDFLSLSLSTEEYAKIGRKFKGGEDVEIYIKRAEK